METAKRIGQGFFSRSPAFGYLAESDRYLSASPEPSYRLNVIGTGLNGQEHMRITFLEGRATVHGVFDPHPSSIAAAQQIHAQLGSGSELVVYASLEAACSDPMVDGLIICTPNYTHIDVTREAVKAGKHILLEKPMASNLADACEILQLADGYPAVFQVGLQYRYKPIYAEALFDALVRRSLGNIKTIHMMEHRVPFLDKVGQWNKFSDLSGGTLVEKCCHYFDLINQFAQSVPVSVSAAGGSAVNFLDFEYEGRRSDIVDNAMVIVTYQNGILASFNLCMFAPLFHEEVVLCGAEGRLTASERWDFLPQPRPRMHLEILRGDGGPSRISQPCYPVFLEESGHNGSTYFEHRDFINQMQGLETSAASARDGFWSIVVAVAAEEAVRSGELVRIDELLNRNSIEQTG